MLLRFILTGLREVNIKDIKHKHSTIFISLAQGHGHKEGEEEGGQDAGGSVGGLSRSVKDIKKKKKDIEEGGEWRESENLFNICHSKTNKGKGGRWLENDLKKKGKKSIDELLRI